MGTAVCRRLTVATLAAATFAVGGCATSTDTTSSASIPASPTEAASSTGTATSSWTTQPRSSYPPESVAGAWGGHMRGLEIDVAGHGVATYTSQRECIGPGETDCRFGLNKTTTFIIVRSTPGGSGIVTGTITLTADEEQHASPGTLTSFTIDRNKGTFTSPLLGMFCDSNARPFLCGL